MFIAWTGIHFCIQGNSHDLYQRSGVNRPRFFDIKLLSIGAGAVRSCARHGQGNEIMNVRRLMMLLFASTAVLFVGCEKENGTGGNGSSVNVPSQVSVKVGQTYNLGSSQTWSSSNKFVATVSNSGIITGQHVGMCTVSCAGGSCQVNVLANINLFQDPITQWGLSKSEVIAREGYDYEETNSGAIGYSTGNSIAPLLMYTFDNNKLKNAGITVKTAYTNQVVDHLSERYRYLGKVGSAFYFADGNSSADAKTAVVLQYYNSSYWVAMYMEHQ